MASAKVVSVAMDVDADLAQSVYGTHDANLSELEERLGIDVFARGNKLTLSGPQADVATARRVLTELVAMAGRGHVISADSVAATVDLVAAEHSAASASRHSSRATASTTPITTRSGKPVHPKTPGQTHYVQAIDEHTITFGIGPAGTGKTYLAVAKAVQALKTKQVTRIILTRPAVEAGEKLGFLPGTLDEKVDPYLRPLYDALRDMLDPEVIAKFVETGVIEVAPLAYMRGRTLSDAFVILDEAQNTTSAQMKMFLTRLGFGTKIVVTGDQSQVDLPRGQRSGLHVAQDVLSDIEDISFCYLTAGDVVRHRLVGKIVSAYEAHEQAKDGDQ